MFNRGLLVLVILVYNSNKCKYSSDTYSFSRIVNNICFAVIQHCNRVATLCIRGY